MGGSGAGEAAEAAALFGAPPEEGPAILAALGGQSETAPLVLPRDCEAAVRLFEAVRLHWHRAGMAGIAYALDLGAVEIAARWLGIAPSARLLGDLAMMESAALEMFAEDRG